MSTLTPIRFAARIFAIERDEASMFPASASTCAPMRRDPITRAEREIEMRLAGIARIADVAWAILEPNGKISFIARPEDGTARQEDDDKTG